MVKKKKVESEKRKGRIGKRERVERERGEESEKIKRSRVKGRVERK